MAASVGETEYAGAEEKAPEGAGAAQVEKHWLSALPSLSQLSPPTGSWSCWSNGAISML